MNLKYFPLLYIVPFLIFSCNETVPDPGYQNGTPYYPIQEGWYMTYQIDTVNIDFDNEDADEEGVVSENSIQLRELIGSPYDDGFGGQNYPLLRYKRDSEEMEWVLDSIWALTYRDNHIIRYENAIPYLKLLNPLQENTYFNQNTYNGLPSRTQEGFDLRYEILRVGRSYYYEGQLYENTAVIQEVNNINTILDAEETEIAVYQKDLGLVIRDYSNTARRYYEFTTEEAVLVGNPYCGDNSNTETIVLGNGTRVANPFVDQDNCETNPIFDVSQDSVDRWISTWENSPNSPIVNWTSGDNGSTIIQLVQPQYYNGYNEVGTQIHQKIIGYGIDIDVE